VPNSTSTQKVLAPSFGQGILSECLKALSPGLEDGSHSLLFPQKDMPRKHGHCHYMDHKQSMFTSRKPLVLKHCVVDTCGVVELNWMMN
jgi:hypothetical protein